MRLFQTSPGEKSSHRRSRTTSIRDALVKDFKTFHWGSQIPLAPTMLEPYQQGRFKKPPRTLISPADAEETPRTRLLRRSKTTPGDSSRGKTIHYAQVEQSASRLFELPIDVREKIWEYVLGGHFFFGGSVVDLGSPDIYRNSDDIIFEYSTPWSEKSLRCVNLLLTCRQV
jgi:hypothetical protein